MGGFTDSLKAGCKLAKEQLKKAVDEGGNKVPEDAEPYAKQNMGVFRDSLKAGCKVAREQIQKAVVEGGNKAPEDPEAYAKKVAESIKADVRMLSGCKDCQYSADVPNVSKFGLPDSSGAGGACTHAMLLTLADEHFFANTWLGLLKGMQTVLANKKFQQIPQLSTSRIIDLHEEFSLLNTTSGGNRKCLLIGINYVGQEGQLNGCHNDVDTMKNFLATHGYSTDEAHCRILVDDGAHRAPTFEGIILGFRWLVENAQAGDSLFLLYSGHGVSIRDISGDEADGMDEALCPVDFRSAGPITDDMIFEEVVMALPKGVTLTAVMDCCHSGTILDLPYMLQADEGTLRAVEAGEVSATSVNPFFTFAKMLAIGKALYSMYQKRAIDKAGMMEIGKLVVAKK